MPHTEPPAPALHESTFPSVDGTSLQAYALLPEQPRASVLLLHGYADHALRYRHVLRALYEAGFAAYALDYRGHGRSGGARGAVGRFEDYLGDVRTAVARIEATRGGPLFLVAHSHGALVAASLLAGDHAPPVAGAVFTGPYFQLKLEPSRWQLFQARAVGRFLPALQLRNPVTPEMLTRDEAMQAEAAADPLKHQVVTPRWFAESTAAQQQLWRQVRRFRVPLLVLQGEADPVVEPSASARFVDSIASTDKRFVPFPGMRHELFHEQGREAPIAETVGWLLRHLPH